MRRRWQHTIHAHWLNLMASICSSSQMCTACPPHSDESTTATEGPYERAPQSGESPARINLLALLLDDVTAPAPRPDGPTAGRAVEGWREGGRCTHYPRSRFMERPSSHFTLADESLVTLLGGRVKGVC